MSDKDFTHPQLRELYTVLMDCGYQILPFLTYLENPPADKKYVILRHDVDRNRKNALEIATIEHELKIQSSFYFRYPSTFDPDLLPAISAMGHEIGYHYEVLAKTRGDDEKAILLFEEELREFRKICTVKTICAHGSPLSPSDNRDLWKKYSFTRFGIRGDAQLSVNAPVSFFTDTGRSWDMRNNLRDSVTNATITAGIRTTGDLIAHITRVAPPALYLVIHPERWTPGGFPWYLQYSRDLAFNCGKTIIRRFR
jgi:hypothetical protein